MLIPPKYFLTPKISQLLSSIEASREVINSISIPIEIERNIRRNSLLKSSLYSARIEGNPLTLEEVSQRPSKDQRKIEVFNILKALSMIVAKDKLHISIKDILNYHKIVMKGLSDVNGKFRTEQNAIFNTAGIAIYLPPPPKQIPSLNVRLIKFANSQKEPFIAIKACLVHFSFEKIHPFLDGNGRIGRLLLQAVLQIGGYGMKGMMSLEEYLDNHRSEYYRSLENTQNDTTDYLEYMLEAIAESSKKAKELILEKKDFMPDDFLLPRRAEILHIINDHKMVNFDIIRRRFLKINERTLRYDLKKLVDSGFIKKLGSTKGVFYTPTTPTPGVS